MTTTKKIITFCLVFDVLLIVADIIVLNPSLFVKVANWTKATTN